MGRDRTHSLRSAVLGSGVVAFVALKLSGFLATGFAAARDGVNSSRSLHAQTTSSLGVARPEQAAWAGMGSAAPRKALTIIRRAEGKESAPGSVGAVVLSGGVGKRMGAKIPKQYLKLLGLEIALHSLEVFLECPRISEVVIVVAEDWQHVFEEHIAKRKEEGAKLPDIKWARGGAERQDSVFNGLAEISTEYVAVHDAARPLVTIAEVEKVLDDATKYGAALLAVQTKATVKKATMEDGEAMVASTPDRSTLWEAHTPQVIKSALLREAFENAKANNLEVTDDVSLVESLGKPVKLTPGEYTNIKVTTPEDIAVAETILRERGYKALG